MKTKEDIRTYQVKWEITHFLNEYFVNNQEYIKKWLATDNPNFGCPPQLLLDKKPEKLLLWFYYTWDENYGYIDWEKDVPLNIKQKNEELFGKGSKYFFLARQPFLSHERGLYFLQRKEYEVLYNTLIMMEESKINGGYV